MSNELLKHQAEAQAIYMAYLAQKAQAQAKMAAEQGKVLAIDPQGRLLVDIKLNAEDIKKIVGQINAIKDIEANFLLTKNGLAAALGMKPPRPSETTTVSLDISKEETLWGKFESRLEEALTKAGVKVKAAGVIKAEVNETPKGSIIALQQEFHFHLGLVTRVYQKATNKFNGKENDMAAAYQEAMLAVNNLVMDAYAKALKGAMNSKGELNLAKLNKALDKARKDIAPKAHTILMQKIVKHTGVILTKNDLKQAKNAPSLKNLAEETTATPNDVLHTDNAEGLITLIEGSERTAHHRETGPHFAHRQLITHEFDIDDTANPVVSASINPRIQIRAPSPVVKKGLTDPEYIADVATKLGHLTEEYSLKTRLSGGKVNEKPKAFIYNRYTALNDWVDDKFSENYQTQSTDHILQGAHQYNAAQLNTGDPVFCFVQAISVNGFGDELGYDGSPLKTEATLMAEMALLHTLYDTSSKQQQAIQDVFAQYNQFLRSNPRDPYFSQSDAGKRAIDSIQALKRQWQKEINNKASTNIVDNAKSALKHLMAHDLHFTHEYAKLFQTLSVFVEEASMGTCKSGNERTQAINGRVAIFDAIAKKQNKIANEPNTKVTLTSEEVTIIAALKTLASNRLGSKIAAQQELKSSVDDLYNKKGLQAAMAIVSMLDQGFSAKVEGKPGHPFFASRNYGEEKASVMSNLHQSKAGKMQAHKDLTKLMEGAWEGYPKSWSKLGIAFAVIFFPIGIPVAIARAYSNSQKKTATEMNNKLLLKGHVNSPESESLIENGGPEALIHGLNIKKQPTKEPKAEKPKKISHEGNTPPTQNTEVSLLNSRLH